MVVDIFERKPVGRLSDSATLGFLLLFGGNRNLATAGKSLND